ncbi:9302_t:CDS:2, partial [Dentiscutata heterogama]
GNENNIVYQHLPQPTDSSQQFKVNVTNIYINNNQINLNGLIWFDSGIQYIQLDDNSASEIVNQLPGGNYSNGIATVDCNISDTFDLSFEIANKKWRLPSSVISKDKVSGTNKCESIITGGANDGSWIFGSAFIANFYMVFDQTNSQFGIASRSDINYGPAPSAPPGSVGIMIQVPGNDAKCLQIKSSKMGPKAFSLSNNTDPDGFYHVDKTVYPAMTDVLYTFYFSPYSLNGSECPVTDDGSIATTPQLKADTTTDPWKITIRAYSVGVKVHVPVGITNYVEIDRVNDIGFAWYTPYFYIDKVDNEGYFYINNFLVYNGCRYIFFATPEVHTPTLVPNLTNDPWAVVINSV